VDEGRTLSPPAFSPLWSSSIHADDATALVTLFNIDMAAMGAMLEDPGFQKLTEDYVVEHIPYSISPLAPPA